MRSWLARPKWRWQDDLTTSVGTPITATHWHSPPGWRQHLATAPTRGRTPSGPGATKRGGIVAPHRRASGSPWRAPHRGWLLPYTTHDYQAIEQVLTQTDLQALRHRLITELSGGEQRRVILARALAQQPQILLLDEPTAHLDLRYQTELLALIRRLAQHDGMAVVVTLHDLNHAALCATRIALLAHGTLVAMGHPEAVLTPDCLSQVYGVTVVVTPHPVYGTPLIAPVFASQQKEQ